MFIVIIVIRTMNNSKIIKTIRPLFRPNQPAFCDVIFLLIDLQRERERRLTVVKLGLEITSLSATLNEKLENNHRQTENIAQTNNTIRFVQQISLISVQNNDYIEI